MESLAKLLAAAAQKCVFKLNIGKVHIPTYLNPQEQKSCYLSVILL